MGNRSWMKRTFSLITSVVLLFSIFSVGVANDTEYVIQPQYEQASPFSDGLARVERGDGTGGFIDTTGKIVIPIKHEYTDNYNDYTWNFTDGMAKILRKGKYGFIDKTGKEVVAPRYNDSQDFKEGLAAVNKGGKWGFVDKTGNEVIQPKYDDAGSFYEGLAWVQQNGKYGFIDQKGTLVIPVQYSSASNFQEGLASVTKGDRTILINQKGNETKLGTQYDIVLSFNEGMGIVINIENGLSKYGVIDKSGKEIVKPKYDRILDFQDGMARVQLHGNWGFIDKTGQEIVKPQYHNSSDYSEGLARVSKNMRFGFIDKTGKEVIALQFEFAWDFNDGLAPVQKNDKWGFISNPLEFAADLPDPWASEGISEAIQAELIPVPLQNGYKKIITRQEFCQLVVHFIEVQSGISIEAFLSAEGVQIPNTPFLDTTDQDVISAYALGIVSGKGAGRFDPTGNITREEASVMLKNTAQKLGLDTSFAALDFTDNELISSWAKDSVAFVYSKGIMSGIGSSKFDPKGSYTRQQAYLTILRLKQESR